MKKRTLNVAKIDVKSLEKAMEVAIQGLNIKREGGLVDLEFVPFSNIVKVKYFQENSTNIEDVIKSWGEVISTKQEVYLSFTMNDVKETLSEDIDSAYNEANEDNYNGEITFSMKD